ncbi:MAG: glycosyltransferase family 87 protein [Elusimicrobiota bacterium]
MKKIVLVFLLVITVLNTLNYRKFLKEKVLHDLVDFYVYYETTIDFFSYKISPYFAVQPNVKGKTRYFIYPPTFLVLFMPVTLFPINISAKIWILLNMFIFFFVSWWFVAKILGLTNKLLLFLILYNFNPFFLCLFIGQIDIVILFFVYLAFYLISKNKQNSIGIIVGFLTLIKLTPIIFSVYFLFKRNLKAIILMLFTVSIFLIFSVLIIPVELYSHFLTALSTVSQNSDRYIMPLSKSVFALLGRMFLDNRVAAALIINSAFLFYILYFLVFAILLAVIFVQLKKLDNLAIFALVILVSVIILPNALLYSMVLTIPAILIFYKNIKTTAGFLLFCLIYFSVTFHYSLYFTDPLGILADFIPLLGNVLLFISIAINLS